MNNKTLIGKNNYLFLMNDSANGLENHCNHKYSKEINISIYNKIIDKFLLIVFPDKECICNNFLPNTFKINNRYCLNKYKLELKNNIIDTTGLLEYTDYYITDTHMNIKGLYKVYKETIIQFNKLFNKNVSIINTDLKQEQINNLQSLQLGLGDLTWDINKGDLKLNNINDVYYTINQNFPFYCKLKITNPLNVENVNINILNGLLDNVTDQYLNNIITWQILSDNIIESKNNNNGNNIKVLIFYDSFLIQIVPLIMKTFKHCFFSKTNINYNLIDKINPNFVLEFRVERFL